MKKLPNAVSESNCTNAIAYSDDQHDPGHKKIISDAAASAAEDAIAQELPSFPHLDWSISMIGVAGRAFAVISLIQPGDPESLVNALFNCAVELFQSDSKRYIKSLKNTREERDNSND